MSPANTGNRPAAAHGRIRSRLAPSRPMTSSGAPMLARRRRPSVHVAESAQPLLRGRVASRLLAGPRVGARLQDRFAELGPHLLRLGGRALHDVRLLAAVLRQIVELLGSEPA